MSSNNSRERRQCRSYTPYLFFLLELVAYAELTYIITVTFEEEKFVYIIVGLSLLYLLGRSYKRFVHIKNRCKSSQLYQKYLKKAKASN